MSPLRFSKLKVLSDELVPSATPPEAEGKPSRALSDLDNSIFVIGYYGGGVASSETVDIPLLRLALSDALAKLPWFAGRFVMRQVWQWPAQYAISWACWSLRGSPVPSLAVGQGLPCLALSHLPRESSLYHDAMCNLCGNHEKALCTAHGMPCHMGEA